MNNLDFFPEKLVATPTFDNLQHVIKVVLILAHR